MTPIEILREGRVLTLIYYGRPLGHIQPVASTLSNKRLYRAVTVLGDIRHFSTLRLAKCHLLKQA